MTFKKLKINTAAPAKPEASILIIYTGGTMGMIMDQNKALVPFDFEMILSQIPTLKSFNLELNVIAFEKPIDSSSILPYHWSLIAQIIEEGYEEHDGFIVLHGTDTMAYSASALSFMLEGLQKPVIFTGAQLPVSSPRSDAQENLITSIEVAAAKRNGKPIVQEVCIYFDYLLLRANRSKKVESQNFDAFRSENYPPLAEAGIHIDYRYNYILQKEPKEKFTVSKKLSDEVMILKLFPGINRKMIESITSIEGLKGIVLETFGSGNAPIEPDFINPLKEAIEKGIIVVNISQCVGGKVMQGTYETSRLLSEIGVIGGKDMTTEAAITKLMYLFGKEITIEKVKKSIVSSLRGEMEDRI